MDTILIRNKLPFESMKRPGSSYSKGERASSSERKRSASRSRGDYSDTYRSDDSLDRVRSSEGERHRSMSPSKRFSPQQVIPHRPVSGLSPSYNGGRRSKKKKQNVNERERDDLNQLLLYERMNVNALEQTITLLRAEHVKKDKKIYKQEMKIENLVDMQSGTKKSPYAVEVRKEIEHDALISLKFQLKELRQAITERDLKIKSLSDKNVDNNLEQNAMIDVPKKSKKKDLKLIEQLKQEVANITIQRDNDINQTKRDLADFITQRDLDVNHRDNIISQMEKELAEVKTQKEHAIQSRDQLIIERDQAIEEKEKLIVSQSNLTKDRNKIFEELEQYKVKYDDQQKLISNLELKCENLAKTTEELRLKADIPASVKRKLVPKKKNKGSEDEDIVEIADQMQSMTVKNDDSKAINKKPPTEDGISATEDPAIIKTTKKVVPKKKKNNINNAAELTELDMENLISTLNTELIDKLNEEKNIALMNNDALQKAVEKLNEEKILLQNSNDNLHILIENEKNKFVEIENEKNKFDHTILEKNNEIKKLQEALKALYNETTKPQTQAPKDAELQKLKTENKNLLSKMQTMTDVQKTMLDKCTELQIQINNFQKELKDKQLMIFEKDNDYKNLMTSIEEKDIEYKNSIEVLQQQLDAKIKAYDTLLVEKMKSDELLGKMVLLNQALKNQKPV